MTDDMLNRLIGIIAARRDASPEDSHTRRLLDAGPEKCGKKVLEEAGETVIAGLAQDDAALTSEAADLMYHLLVLLEVRGVRFDAVLAELESRMGTSGLAEKAAREPGKT